MTKQTLLQKVILKVSSIIKIADLALSLDVPKKYLNKKELLTFYNNYGRGGKVGIVKLFAWFYQRENMKLYKKFHYGEIEHIPLKKLLK